MAIATAIMMARVMSAASQKSIFFSRKVTKVSAAHRTIDPCAKLNTPDALKISTKPMATSEYITPASRPPTSVSIKKLMTPSMNRAEIGCDDVRVVAHLFGRPIADLAAVVEHHDMMRKAHHDADVVLNQHDCRSKRAIGLENEPAHLALFIRVHAGHRLVQKQKRRLSDQSTRQIDAFLHAVAQGGDDRMAVP